MIASQERMPTVELRLLPKMTEDQRRLLHKKVVGLMMDLDIPNIIGEESFFTFFVRDDMRYGIGKEAVVKIDNLPQCSECNSDALKKLSKGLAGILRGAIPKLEMVVCVIGTVEDISNVVRSRSWVIKF